MTTTRLAEELEDYEVVDLCRKGDFNAFAILVRRHQRAMLNIAFRITGDYDDACDVVQDAFIAAYRGLSSFRGTARFSTWLTTITLNHSRNHISQNRSRRRYEESVTKPIAGAMYLFENLPSSAPSALDRLEGRAVSEKVRDCISALPIDFREVLVLRDLEEYSYEEVGTTLGIQEGTVKSRLFRAREGVKDCLKRILREL
jgi:RNA polymerase sigma-70 factor (ECF subfamily)